MDFVEAVARMLIADRSGCIATLIDLVGTAMLRGLGVGSGRGVGGWKEGGGELEGWREGGREGVRREGGRGEGGREGGREAGEGKEGGRRVRSSQQVQSPETEGLTEHNAACWPAGLLL